MHRNWIFILAVGGTLFLGGCKKTPSTPPPTAAVSPTLEDLLPKQAQPKLETTELWLGPGKLTAELALTGRQMQTGMMFRTNMGSNEAMLFAFPEPFRVGFWMKNTMLKLSAAYVSPDGTIQEIHDLQPFDTNTVLAAAENIQFVIETPQGWFRQNNVSTGMVVRTEHGSLMDMYRGKQQ